MWFIIFSYCFLSIMIGMIKATYAFEYREDVYHVFFRYALFWPILLFGQIIKFIKYIARIFWQVLTDVYTEIVK